MNAIQVLNDWQNVGVQKGLFESTKTGGLCMTSKEYKKLISCPMKCGQKETNMHYMQCQSTKAQEQREQEIQHITNTLKKIQTFPGIIAATLACL